MKDSEGFIKAYQEFKRTVDFSRGGVLPELDTLVWYLVMGLPEVPADKDSSTEGTAAAIDQRIAILKAVFVEVNGEQGDAFLDQGLRQYDQAGRMAKRMLEDPVRGP